MGRTRRTVLAALGSGGVAVTGGCLGALADGRESRTRLGSVDLLNLDDSPHRFALRVTRGDATVHESAHRLAGDGGSVAGVGGACPWMDDPGRYAIEVDGPAGDRLSQAVETEAERALVQVVYDGWNRSRLAVFVESAGGAWSPEADTCRLARTPTS